MVTELESFNARFKSTLPLFLLNYDQSLYLRLGWVKCFWDHKAALHIEQLW